MSLSKKASKAKTIEVKKTVLEWCKDQVAQGKELKICWEGGGDSGWAYFEIDGIQTENAYTNHLVDSMYHELDYGSWAGEFSASGSAIFDPEENAFIGIDDYKEDERVSYGCNISLRVPNNLWYDRIHYRIECSYDESVSAEVNFGIQNGFLTEEHKQVERILEDVLNEEVPQVIAKFVEQGNEFRDIWESDILLKSEGEDKNGYTEFTITTIDIGTYTSDEKSVFLHIEEDETIIEENQ